MKKKKFVKDIEYRENKFPIKKYYYIENFIDDYCNNTSAALTKLDKNSIKKIFRHLLKSYQNNTTVYVCGNGGSAALSNHFACDHEHLFFKYKNIKSKIISLCSNSALMTAISNDYKYENIFLNQIKKNIKKVDTLIAISSSGNSKNVINAINYANKLKAKTISFTGFDGGVLKKISNINIHCNSKNYGIIEATHHSVINIIAQFIKQKFTSKNKIKSIFF